MKHTKNWQNSLLKAGISLALVLGILLGLAAPGITLERETRQDPLKEQTIQQVTVLQVGDDLLEGSPIAIPVADQAQTPNQEAETQPAENASQLPQEQPQPEQTLPGSEQGQEGNDQGNQGDLSADPSQLDLAMVFSWYKYGTQEKSVSCVPMETVQKTINVTQLENGVLAYRFSPEGGEAGRLDRITVSYAEGNGVFRQVDRSGELSVTAPQPGESRKDTFQVTAYWKPDGAGEQKITFTFVLRWENAPDLDLTLTWHRKDGQEKKVLCAADQTQAFAVADGDLAERVLSYSVSLSGELAQEAVLRQCTYTTGSAEDAGSLDPRGGSKILKTPSGLDTETYYLDFLVETPQREIHFHFVLTYRQTADVRLRFVWREGGKLERELLCTSGSSVTQQIRGNQLSGGTIPYELALTGADAGAGVITSVICSSDDQGGRTLSQSGNLALSIPEKATENTYRIQVTVAVRGQLLRYEVLLHYARDVALRMWYTVDGQERSLLCENGKTKTADAIYDDQLEDGNLSYRMVLEGVDSETITIEEVTLYQTGSRVTLRPGVQDRIQLLLNQGKTGENTFTVQAKSTTGQEYSFRLSLPFKHRGENTVQIQVTNLAAGQKVINETPITFRVLAWSQDAGGNIQYIPANGTDTRLEVTLDGQPVSGLDLEYTVYPQNPEEGDSNTHILHIYAEDSYGNHNEKELVFFGQRREEGTKAGTASIYVDLTVLGLGVVGPISYQVLAEEPLSYTVVKAVMGQDTGEPFGAAEDSFGWPGRYAGTLDVGFYLSSLTTGLTANALEASVWPGSTEQETLEAIDARFGARTGLATLWRCIYRNGVNKSAGSGSTFGEFDYTTGSGWLYSIGGTYYPGQSMSNLYLKDGDLLFLRYSLAYGWDVGGGTDGYGNPVGYCVTARNGDWSIHHEMEEVANADGTVSQVCRCCGIVEDCLHQQTVWTDLGDGTHVEICQQCQAMLGTPAYHQWSFRQGETANHFCERCGSQEGHFWRELDGSTATCTEPGLASFACNTCGMVKEKTVPPTGHTLNNSWNYDLREHYQKCSQCLQEFDRGPHSYRYDAGWDDFLCQGCGALHGFDVGCGGELTILSATCQQICYRCGECGYDLVKNGSFDQYHSYQNGVCLYCGQPDPGAHTHDYQHSATVEADCENDGYMTFTCDCGDFYTQPILSAGHKWSGWTTVRAPSPEQEGVQSRSCTACGQEQTQPLPWQG